MNYDLLIENASVFTMDAEDTVIEDGVIGINNGVISLLEKKMQGVCFQAALRQRNRRAPRRDRIPDRSVPRGALCASYGERNQAFR